MILRKVRVLASLGDHLAKRLSVSAARISNNTPKHHPVSSVAIVKSPYDDVKVPNCTLPEYIWAIVDRWPSQTAMECGFTGRSFSYAHMRLMAIQFAASLLKIGLQPKDLVIIILPNIPEFAAVILGALEAGIIVSPISPLYTDEEICLQVNGSNSKCIVTHIQFLPKILHAKNKLQKPLHIICVNDSFEKLVSSEILHFSELISQNLDTTPVKKICQRINLDETALLLYSSGTTGLPKGVCHTHRTLTTSVEQISQPELSYIAETTSDHQSVVSGILPFSHIYGLCVVLFHAIRKGAKLVTLPKFHSVPFLKLLENNKDISLHVVPSVMLFLGSHPSVKLDHLKNIKSIVTGGAPCSASDVDKIQDKCNITVTQAYGMTEASLLALASRNSKDYSSLGPPVSNTSGKVVCKNNPNKILPFGDIGELCFKGPQIMKGYYNLPSATSNTIDKEGWLHTGDLGYANENGHFYLVDRVKELIKVKGFQVAPAELESILRQHPDVLDAGVTAVPSNYSGEKPVAFVVTKPNLKQFNPKNIMDFMSQKVAPYKQLAHVYQIGRVPRSFSGKILRRELKQIVKKIENFDDK